MTNGVNNKSGFEKKGGRVERTLAGGMLHERGFVTSFMIEVADSGRAPI